MTGEEMEEYINQLSSSMHGQSSTGNFGVGAKIAAATRNHAGLVYLEWKDGVGYMTHLWRDPTGGLRSSADRVTGRHVPTGRVSTTRSSLRRSTITERWSCC